MVHCYSTYETINQFEIGCIINPSLKCNKVFRVQFEKCLSVSFDSLAMETIKNCLKKNNTCVMPLMMIMRITEEIQKKLYRVLSCVVYYLIENYVCIDYLSCQ